MVVRVIKQKEIKFIYEQSCLAERVGVNEKVKNMHCYIMSPKDDWRCGWWFCLKLNVHIKKLNLEKKFVNLNAFQDCAIFFVYFRIKKSISKWKDKYFFDWNLNNLHEKEKKRNNKVYRCT